MHARIRLAIFRTQAGLYVEWDSIKAACKCKLMCTCACMPAPRTPGHSQESGLSLQSSLPRSVSIGGRGSSIASSNPSMCPAPQTLSVPLFLSVGCPVSSASHCSGHMYIRVDIDICRHTHRQTHAERHRHVHTQTQTHTYAHTHTYATCTQAFIPRHSDVTSSVARNKLTSCTRLVSSSPCHST